MTQWMSIRSEPDLGERSHRLINLDDEVADEVFGALSSRTARHILAVLHDEPRPASEIAEAVDTSVQNVHYHLENLQDTDLIDVVDRWYSETGREMKVYAPTDTALLLVASEEPDGSLRQLAERFLGMFLVVAIGAIVSWRYTSQNGSVSSNNEVSYDIGGSSAGVDPVLIVAAVFAGAVLAIVGYLLSVWVQRWFWTRV